ncbi:hypothetical protein HNQ76_002026 [Thermosulfuriphilus ammonigenes]|nr:hypothetical protein [Thermosulfuriphilus ammonigenes]
MRHLWWIILVLAGWLLLAQLAPLNNSRFP